jgi:hypothetical protein
MMYPFERQGQMIEELERLPRPGEKKATCSRCSAERPIKGRAILPDGWTFSAPDGDGKVEPLCRHCSR